MNAKALDDAVAQYVYVWYNHVRPHSYNNWMTLLKHQIYSEFFEQSVTKMLDQYTETENREGIGTVGIRGMAVAMPLISCGKIYDDVLYYT